MYDGDMIEEPTTRAGFVKRLGKLAAIGLGIALVPATSAQAILFKCCRDTSCDGPCTSCCYPHVVGYRCPSNPCASCCICFSSNIGSCTQSMSQCPC
jgi:hypothetical protein